MRFWVGRVCLRRQPHNILWDSSLRVSLSVEGIIIQLEGRYLGIRSDSLRIDLWKGSLFDHQQHGLDENCNLFSIQIKDPVYFPNWSTCS
jgi:hypothetical protein